MPKLGVFPQDGKAWNEAIIQSRTKLLNFPGYGLWRDIPAGPEELNPARARIKALRERADSNQEQFRLVVRSCVVIDYDLADGTPLDQTTGG